MSLFSDLNGLKFNTSKSYLVPKFSVPAQAIQSHYKVVLCSDKLRVFGIKYRRFLQRGNDSVLCAYGLSITETCFAEGLHLLLELLRKRAQGLQRDKNAAPALQFRTLLIVHDGRMVWRNTKEQGARGFLDTPAAELSWNEGSCTKDRLVERELRQSWSDRTGRSSCPTLLGFLC